MAQALGHETLPDYVTEVHNKNKQTNKQTPQKQYIIPTSGVGGMQSEK